MFMNIISALLLFQVTSIEEEKISSLSFPEMFHGVWDVNSDACKGAHSNIRISIDGAGIQYWESDGKPVELFLSGDRDLYITLNMSGEGQAWKSKTRFVISEHGNRLFAENIPQKGEEFFKTIWFYERCPVGTKMGW